MGQVHAQGDLLKSKQLIREYELITHLGNGQNGLLEF
jgi:hypothetical protein